MDDVAVPGVEELLALNSHLRQQVKQDADLIITLQLQLREKDDIISMLRKSHLAAATSAPLLMRDKQRCADFEVDPISPSRVQEPKPSATSAIKTGTLAENSSSVKFKQRKRIKRKLKSSSMSVGGAVSVDAERDGDATKKRKISAGTPASLDVDESGANTNTRRHVLISAKRCPVALSQGVNLPMIEENERSLSIPHPRFIQSIPVWFLRDIFSHFDVCTKFRLQRVNSWWKAELDTLQLERRVQFMDLTEFLRMFIRANCRGEVGKSKDDKSIIHSWLAEGDGADSRLHLLSERIQCLADRYPVTEEGTVVVKLHDGFDYDSYIAENYWQTSELSLLPSKLLECGAYFCMYQRVVFVDSVLSQVALNFYSTNRSIGLIRTTVHANSICQHLLQPLHVVSHFTAVGPGRYDALWGQLLDTHGQLSDMESLSLLKQSMVKERKKDLRNFNEKLAKMYMLGKERFDMRDDLRNCNIAAVDMSKLYPSTIYKLVSTFHSSYHLVRSKKRCSHGTYCLQCATLGE